MDYLLTYYTKREHQISIGILIYYFTLLFYSLKTLNNSENVSPNNATTNIKNSTG